MRKILIVLSIVFCFSSFSFSQSKGVGLGIIIGEPTGISLKSFLSPNTAFDAGFAWSFIDNGSFHIHGDFLVHDYSLLRVSSGRMPVYYGIGGRIKLKNESRGRSSDEKFGIRIPVGFAYEFPGDKVDMFLEVVPVLDVTPETKVNFNAAVGARYYF